MLSGELARAMGDWLWHSNRIGNELEFGLGCLDNSVLGRTKGRMESTGYEARAIALCGSLLWLMTIVRAAWSLAPHGRMDWRLSSAPLERCAQNVTPSAYKLRLSSKTSLPGHVPLVLGLNSSSTSTGHWRNARSYFAYRKWIWRCKRRYWRRSRHATCIPSMGGIYQLK
jgi:hypothetical protein